MAIDSTSAAPLQPAAAPDGVRAAQRAFFQTARGVVDPAPPAEPVKAAAPARAAAPAAVAASAPAEPSRNLRPGSLIDVRV
jgi:hypothetical protein